MIRKYVLSLVAVGGFLLALWTVSAGSKPTPGAAPVVSPSRSPYAAFVAGAGIVESSSRDIEIGTPVPGLVVEVMVEAGDAVKLGHPLFRLDDRDLQAQLSARNAALMATKAQLAKFEALPRPEDVPPAAARVKAVEMALADVQSELTMWESVADKRAVSQEILDRRRFAEKVAQANLEAARAELALLEAGSWKPDIDIAKAQVVSAEALVHQTQTDIERLTIRSPIDGQVLQANVRGGEFAPAGRLEDPLMMVGSIDSLHVRVDVDENDAWRVVQNAKATANLRGNPQMKTELAFVRFEPFVVPKRSLTGAGTERVDTRVLQVIYRFDRADLRVFVGQLMDVFIEAEPVSSTTIAAKEPS